MKSLESQNQSMDLSTKIKNIYDKIDKYTDKRGSKEEAIDIINSEIIFSDESVFANGKNNSFKLSLSKLNYIKGDLEGEFTLGINEQLDSSITEMIGEYMDFLEIDYKIQLNVKNIGKLVEKVVNMIEGFFLVDKENYRIDLGEENLVTMVGWEDIYLNDEKKLQYIKGALLSFEDESDYITRVSKLDDMYLLSGKDGTEVRLYIRSTRLVLESDFVHTTKLPLYVQALDKYLLQEYKEKFGLQKKEMSKTVKTEVKKKKNSLRKILDGDIIGLFSKDSGLESEIIYSETEEESTQIEVKEDIRGKPFLEEVKGESELDRQGRILEMKKKDNNAESWLPGRPFFDEKTEESSNESSFHEKKRILEKQIEDKQLLTIINRILEHIQKKIYTIENYKKTGNGKEKNRKKEELEKIQEFVLAVNLLEIYKYYRKHFIEDVLNLVYLKDIIRKKIDIHTIGFDHYFYCGDNKKKIYEDNNAEATHDIGYSPNALYIHASIQKNRRLIYNTQLDIQVTERVKERPIRRYSRDGAYMIMSTGEYDGHSKTGIYYYYVYHLDSENSFLDIKFPTEEKIGLTRRCKYDMIDDYLLVIGDEKIRVIFVGEDRKKDFALSVHSDNYTIATESTNLFVYSNKKLVICDIINKKIIKVIEFYKLFGDTTKVYHMHAREGQVKIIYMKDGKLNYSIYNEKDLLKNNSYVDSVSSVVVSNTTFSKPIAHYDITNINNIDLANKIQGAELFFSEDNKYAIFVKDKIIYTIRFTEYGIKLFTTETMGINHIFRVRYSPDGACAILRDGNVVYKLDLDLIDNLQTDEEEEKKLKLLEERKNLVKQLGYIRDKKLLEEQEIKKQNLEMERKLLLCRTDLVNVLNNYYLKGKKEQEIIDIGLLPL